VKRILKISAVLGISVLYCFLISVNRAPQVFSNPNVTHSECGFFISDASSPLLHSGERSETLANVNSSVSHLNVKNSFNQFFACLATPVRILNNKFLPIFIGLGVAVSLFTSTDIIFPFHYFW
jgi:hypothetical protein